MHDLFGVWSQTPQRQMEFVLLLLMVTACAAITQDLTDKMFTFPQESNTAYVKLTPKRVDFGAITVCLRTITDLNRNHGLFSLSAPPSDSNAFLIFNPAAGGIQIYAHNKQGTFRGDYKVNTWHSICSTWDSVTGLVQLWLDNKPFIRKYVGGARIRNPVIIIGQLIKERYPHGGGFDKTQSFVGMISDVHMWDYTLSACEIQKYMLDRNLTPGNVLNWKALDYTTYGRVLTEQKTTCSCTE
ncbi:C-reactive protein-like isoform X2 [Trematomus bernacchii]|uniref:C-reactive protein-like isoform X2 n=2 Tax=Trematomus bernacchii TaxID=40690 RepID=UPI00146A460C|nr:C-reactive protein-like isoform X2 [Trematomus bernacchii]